LGESFRGENIVSELNAEVERIEQLSGNWFGNFDVETRMYEEFRLLCCILCRLDSGYFRRSMSDRKTTTELLGPAMKEKAMLLSKFICSSDAADNTKWVVCGEVESFLKKVCAVGPNEIVVLRKVCSFDPTDGTHGIFAGLEA
jgi:hypothetical protein